jgi:hypothetical protein
VVALGQLGEVEAYLLAENCNRPDAAGDVQ